MSLFTPEDLLLYAYKEASPHKTLAIKLALAADINLQESLNTILETKKALHSMPLHAVSERATEAVEVYFRSANSVQH